MTAPELPDTVQGLRVRYYPGDHPTVRVGLHPAGIAIDTANPDRLRGWARLLLDAADQLDRAHRAEPGIDQPSLFEDAS